MSTEYELRALYEYFIILLVYKLSLWLDAALVLRLRHLRVPLRLATN